jgi:hypothetical protein
MRASKSIHPVQSARTRAGTVLQRVKTMREAEGADPVNVRGRMGAIAAVSQPSASAGATSESISDPADVRRIFARRNSMLPAPKDRVLQF